MSRELLNAPKQVLELVGRLRRNLNSTIETFQSRNPYDDNNGLIFFTSLLIFVVFMAARLFYVTDSGVPVANPDTSRNLVLCVISLSAAALASRFGLVEASLAMRAGALVTAAACWMKPACAIIFHTGRSYAFIDNWLAAADERMGFHWLAYFRFFDDRPVLWNAMYLAYASIYLQLPLLILIFAFSRKAKNLYTIMVAQLLALTTVSIIAVCLPALGTYAYYHQGTGITQHHSFFIAPDEVSLSIKWLRQENLTTMAEVPPLITFPSFHACSAVIYAWAAWSIKIARWPSIATNILMLAATPVLGCHYLVDVIAGALVAVLALIAAETAIRGISSALASARSFKVVTWAGRAKRRDRAFSTN